MCSSYIAGDRINYHVESVLSSNWSTNRLVSQPDEFNSMTDSPFPHYCTRTSINEQTPSATNTELPYSVFECCTAPYRIDDFRWVKLQNWICGSTAEPSGTSEQAICSATIHLRAYMILDYSVKSHIWHPIRLLLCELLATSISQGSLYVQRQQILVLTNMTRFLSLTADANAQITFRNSTIFPYTSTVSHSHR